MDNTMRAPEETEDCGRECFALLQRGAADLHRELGDIMRSKHPVTHALALPKAPSVRC